MREPVGFSHRLFFIWVKIKGGTPGEGSPLNPLLRFNKHKESSALKRSAGKGSAPAPRRL